MIWSIAWRNIWRNRIRSLVVILAVSIGLIGSLFLIALTKGMVQQKIDADINNEISHIQIHHKDFLKDKTIENTIRNTGEVETQLSSNQDVKSFCSRITLTAMASTATNGKGITIMGIDPASEQQVTKIYSAIVDGSYFESESKTPLMVVGQKFADKLNARTGSKIVITILDSNGELVYGLFRIVGLFKTSNTSYDEQSVFVQKEDLADLIGVSPDLATEYAIMVHEIDQTDIVAGELKNKLPDLEVMKWMEIRPFLLGLSSMMDQFSVMLLVIILIALAFGIINTMLMVILERKRELGMLMAVGLGKKSLFMMIMLETIFLTLAGTVIGVIISVTLIETTGINGINFAAYAEGFESYGYNAHVYPSLYLSFYIMLTVLVIITAIVSSVFPARKALKLNPAEAVREDA